MRQHGASLSKGDRLCGIKAISDLFSRGKTLYNDPLKSVWLSEPGNISGHPVRVLISVPKRHFKKAVDRNLIKRRIREAYRLNRQPLVASLSGSGRRMDIAIIYNDTIIQPYNIIEKSVKATIAVLSHQK